MIVVTGAAGFIGSYIVGKLNREGFKDIVLVDKFNDPLKDQNYQNKTHRALVDRDNFFTWLAKHHPSVQIIIHMGARTDTIGQEPEVYHQLNLEYSQKIWKACIEHGLPLIYASSASTYGDGSKGFNDDHHLVPLFEPLNLYARSKHDFDKWALGQTVQPYFWAGLKFFNVFGPNEYHKGRMASVILQAFQKIGETGEMRLFRSHRSDIADGEQARDFIYVEDVARVVRFFMDNRACSGIYNVGTGRARTYLDLAKAVFRSMGLTENIGFTDTPDDLRGKYQYYTCANIEKLRSAGYGYNFFSLEDGIDEYVNRYMKKLACY
ncbi:MAG: ADP-glyceromanno-heptose 6-epimerase [Prolixibacteraceae bacterium]|jgi:ADP-L-glycero-D-manno-heptose 6-epimerase|nr:ADP-glyceromanno-heptose 6-epimerase [Prolixibacteraceae bacterium]